MMEFVNPYVLYYYRNARMLSFRKLAEYTKISEQQLRNFETIIEGKSFFKTTAENIKRLRNALDCDEIIKSKNAPDNMIRFYQNYKGKGRFYPVENIKAVIFDFDGTLTNTPSKYSSWQLIWLQLGYNLDDCGRYYRKFMNNELTHQEWCDVTAENFIERDLSKSEVEKIAEKITLVNGTIDTLKILKKMG